MQPLQPGHLDGEELGKRGQPVREEQHRHRALGKVRWVAALDFVLGRVTELDLRKVARREVESDYSVTQSDQSDTG